MKSEKKKENNIDISLQLISRMKKRLILFVGCLIVIIAIAIALLDSAVYKTKKNALIINTGGSQRMLSQRIVVLAQRLSQQGLDPVFRLSVETQLLNFCDIMEKNLQDLTSGTMSQGMSEDVKSYYFGPNAHVARDVTGFVKTARLLVEGGYSQEKMVRERERLYQMSRDAFIANLNKIVGLYQADSEKQVSQIRRGLIISSILFLAILLLTVVTIFKPIIDQLNKDVFIRRQNEEKIKKSLKVISDSINYASRIQRSILPDSASLEKIFKDYFVLWKPRDVVGGDLYWHRTWGAGSLVLLGDCTGHGVPGAFMTLISNGALDEAYLETPPGDPAALLQRMHQLIQTSLGQDQASRGRADDGLEVGACFIDGDNSRVIFAGSRFDLFVEKDGEVEMTKGVKAGLGYRSTPHDVQFTNHEVVVEDGQTFYMTSDGFIDQVGGEKKRGFGKKRFKALITSLKDVPLSEQRGAFHKGLLDYQGSQKRRDDVAVIGFRLSESREQTMSAGFEHEADELMTGYQPLDNDHIRLLGLVKKLGNAIELKKEKKIAQEIFDDLVSYTEWHFRHEERLMQISDYPGLSHHQNEHKMLVDQALAIKKEIEETGRGFTSELMPFLMDWLNIHIHKVDQKLADYLINVEAGVSSPEKILLFEQSLQLGYQPIDDDHMKLADLINQLYAAGMEGRDHDQQSDILGQLVDYTSWHFRHEQRLMQACGYPETDLHIKEHKKLLDQVQAVQRKYDQAEYEDLTELNTLLKDWLIGHILKVDSKLVDYLLTNQ